MSAQPPAFENVDKCRKCSTAFSLFTRKHHCRNCGRTFCNNCSSGNIALPHFNISEAVRVCGECEQSIKKGGTGGRTAPKAAAAAAPAAAPARRSVVEEPVAPTPPAKKVTKCTCNSPLCICAPDPEPVESHSSSSHSASSSSSSSSVSAPPKKVYASATPSSFQGFGGSSAKQSIVYDLKGDLNEQLREAVKAQDLAGVTQMLNAGADARYIDRTGNAVAHLAAMFNRFDILQLLAAKGADFYVRNPAKETPIDLAPPALQKKMRELQPQKA